MAWNVCYILFELSHNPRLLVYTSRTRNANKTISQRGNPFRCLQARGVDEIMERCCWNPRRQAVDQLRTVGLYHPVFDRFFEYFNESTLEYRTAPSANSDDSTSSTDDAFGSMRASSASYNVEQSLRVNEDPSSGRVEAVLIYSISFFRVKMWMERLGRRPGHLCSSGRR